MKMQSPADPNPPPTPAIVAIICIACMGYIYLTSGVSLQANLFDFLGAILGGVVVAYAVRA
jgi:hypothetical protein